MSLETIHILASSQHYSEPFLCSICTLLPEPSRAVVTTICSHSFCFPCLERWLRSSPKCPSCNTNILFSSNSKVSKNDHTMMIGNNLVYVSHLSEAQPLAFRCLKRIKVTCPLRTKHGCAWSGDYGDLQTHLLSESAHLNKSKRVKQNNCSSGKIKTHDKGPTTTGKQQKDLSQKVEVEAEAEVINERISLAESFKTEANAQFSMRNYTESRALYKKALSVLGDSLLLSFNNNNIDERKMASILHWNIAATHMMTKEFQKCVDHCTNAIDLDCTYTKVYIRKAKALIALGQFVRVFNELRNLLDKDGTNQIPNEMKPSIQEEYKEAKKLHDLFSAGEQQLKAKEYITAKASFGKLLKHSNASNIIINAARADLGLGLTDSSLRLSLQVLRSDPTCAEGYEVRGVTMLLMDDFDSAIQLLKEGLRLNPDSDTIKDSFKACRSVYQNVKDARSAVYHRKFNDAAQFFTTAIDQQLLHILPPKAPLYSNLLTERGQCFLRLKQYNKALSDASKAVYALDDCIPAWVIMANALHGMGRHEEALTQMEDLMNKWGSNNGEIRRAYEKADFEVKKLKRPNLYSLFGVSPLASEMELKKAYKIQAKLLHPDRLSGSNYSDKQRREAENKFKLLGQGLEILCDDFKRQLWDEGYDQEAIRERVAAAHQAAHRKGRGGQQYHHNH